MRHLSLLQPIHKIIACCAILLSLPSFAEAPRWYEVEVALIGYQDSSKINHENWPEILTNEQASDLLEEDINIIETEKDEPWSWINWWNSEDQKNDNLYNVQGIQASDAQSAPALQVPFTEQGIAFEDKVEKFNKAKELQVIWSKKWQQPIPEKEGATDTENTVKIDFRTPLNFQKSIKSSAPLLEAEVSGEIYLYRSRYLHLVSELNIQHWQSLDSSSPLDKSINVLPSHTLQGENIIPSKSSTPLTAINEIPLRAASVNQSRRMRSNELHYIDHPLLGILVRVTPIAEVTE